MRGFSIRRKTLKILIKAAAVLFLTAIIVCGARAEVLPIKTFTAADGLGSGYVTHLMKDSRGFLWFATRDGLTRFDGSRFINYRVSSERNSPPGIEQILETRSGVYWITTTGGLYRYDPRRGTENESAGGDRPTLGAEFVSDSRGTLFEDTAGNLWVGGDALYRAVEGADGSFSLQKVELNLPLNPKTELTVNHVVESRDGSLWIITSWGVVRRAPDGRAIFYQTDGSRGDTVSSVLEDSAGRIWLARPSKFYIIKPEPVEAIPSSTTLDVRWLDAAVSGTTKTDFAFPETPGAVFRYADIENFAGEGTQKFLYQTSDGHMWITYGLGAIEFDGAHFTPHTTEQGFIKGGGQIVEDAAGNLWFGWSTGLMRLNRDGLATYGLRDGLKNLAILNIGETTDGAIYTGDADFNVSRFDGRQLESVRPGLPPKTRTIWMSKAVFQDSAGEWWFLSNEKLYRFAAGDFAALNGQKPLAEYDTADGFKGSSMSHIFEDSEKNLWISNRGPNVGQSGLARWLRREEKFYFFSESDGLPPNKSVSAFAEDALGNRWFGFYEGGLARFSGGRLKMFSSAATSGVITALHLDKKGRLWMTSSQSGLTRIENTGADELTFTSYTTESGLTSNNARSMTEDDYGQIYVGTARGVDRFSPDTGQIKHYTTSDGLAGDFVTVSFRASDGALWFGTPNGLSRLVPKPVAKEDAPPVWLSGLRIAGERQAVSELGEASIENLRLDPAQNNLQIEFFGLDFKASVPLRYQYKLEGADKDWSAPTAERSVNYANLSAGDYRFLVRAVSADGGESVHPASISFVILRPVWQRWWFLTLVALASAGLIYMIYSYRLRRLLEIERVRTRIATDLHDDIGASLSKIAILTDVIHQRITPESAPIRQPLEEIAGTSRELVDSMADIVWAISPKRDHLSDLLHRMRNLAGEMTELADIRLIVHLSNVETVAEMPLGTDVRREVYLIFKETINNLVKHADCSTVEIEFSRENDFLIVSVKDDGKGFTPSANGSNGSNGTRGGNGLPNMRRRAANLGGSYEIESEIGKGTTARLRVPLKKGFRLKFLRQ